MLISTSRKPSAKTRKFCKNFSHATGSNYINRGKMNLRGLLLKALELEEKNIAVVNEIKGNPSRIIFYSNNGDVITTILISATVTNERLHIKPDTLKIISDFEEFEIFSEIFGFELADKADNNFILITKGNDDSLAKMKFINTFGDEIDFQINIKKVI